MLDLRLNKDFEELKHLSTIDNIIERVGFDLDLIKNQLFKMLSLGEEITFLENIHSMLDEVYSEYDNLSEELLVEYTLYLEGKYDQIKHSQEDMRQNGEMVIKDYYHLLKNDTSIRIFDLVLDEVLFNKAGEGWGYLEHIACQLAKLQSKIDFFHEQRENLFKCLPTHIKEKKTVEKYVWMKPEKSLIKLFKDLIKAEYVAPVNKLNDFLGQHFVIKNQKLIPNKSTSAFHKIVWLKDVKDLHLLINYLSANEYYEFNKAKHILLINHFKMIDKELVLSKVRDYANQIKKRQDDYLPSESLQEILPSLK